ncbi:hypothetical protein [Billgrantia endophytica]|uniref:Uncharacterized protein n=1 Tax=Billgrantia endophytica TaxID=2033802 RepID=A0A2N7TZF9_9GAMM|nr:hypothetical protein [Halomonas endophytica]PMR73565.1 hypothetical protein C1H69_16705 [Halomonas endophytica]
MPKVMIVPETDEYALDVSHSNTVWVTKALGTPRLDEHHAPYLAPLWLKAPSGVTRIYHILGVKDIGHATEISLGNSFILPESWDAPGQRRRFEYRDLSDFGFVEIKQGLLLHIGGAP